MKVISDINDETLFTGTLKECKDYIVKTFTLQETLDMDIDIINDIGRCASYILEWK